jgi:CheY-like chemotaxis protein
VTPKLLLADDSVTIQRVIELTFADEDVQVLAVGDGQQAIERVKTERPDIVLADVGMPERDGYEVAAYIKNDPQLAHIPVLLLTGAFEPVDEVRARAVGCDGVLVKPFEPQMVISRVRDLLAGNREAAKPSHTPVSGVAAPLVVETGRHDAAALGEEVGGANALEAYFDRLDAALATKTSTPPPPPEPIERAPAGATVVPFLPETPAAPPPPRPVAAVPQPAAPPVVPATSAPASPAQAAPSPPVVERPAQPEPVQSEISLQEAFAALLAAEQTAGRAQSPAPVASGTISNETIDEICRRVIARMGDEGMRAAVLDTAERLVREEIARIKSQA